MWLNGCRTGLDSTTTRSCLNAIRKVRPPAATKAPEAARGKAIPIFCAPPAATGPSPTNDLRRSDFGARNQIRECSLVTVLGAEFCLVHLLLMRTLQAATDVRGRLDPTCPDWPQPHTYSARTARDSYQETPPFSPPRTAAGILSSAHCRTPLPAERDNA